MKRKLLTALCTTVLSLSMCIPAFAGQWVSNANGWWWQNDDGSWPADSWQWLDGNQDGISECYFFNQDGYLLVNTTTPDGYKVNADGAWTENGVVQTKGTISNPETTNHTAVQTDANVPNIEGTYSGTYDGKQIQAIFEKDGDTVWVEIDFFVKDSLPPYKGNGLFEDEYYSYQFMGTSSLIFKDIVLGETVYFVKH